MFFQKFDPRAAVFDSALSSMQDCGVINYFFRRETPFRGIREQQQASAAAGERPLVLQHFYLLLAFGAGGLAAGLAALGLELRHPVAPGTRQDL